MHLGKKVPVISDDPCSKWPMDDQKLGSAAWQGDSICSSSVARVH